MVIRFSGKFERHALKLPKNVQIKLTQKTKLFGVEPHHSSLKTHKLSGKLKDHWSFSIDYHYRVLFRFVNKNTVIFLDIGTHQIYH